MSFTIFTITVGDLNVFSLSRLGTNKDKENLSYSVALLYLIC